MADLKGDAAAIIEAIESLHGGEAVRLHGDNYWAYQLPSGMKLQSLKPLIDEYRNTPLRRRGTASVQTVGCLVQLTNRFKDAHSCLFAKRSAEKPALTAVINYNRPGEEILPDIGGDSDVARHGDHRIVYAFPVSEEWKAWTELAGVKMSQADFAEFLEDRIRDVMPPPGSADLTDGRFPGVYAFADLVGGTWAGPAQLIDLSRGLAVRVNSKIKDARNLSTGETQIQYETEHADASGAPLKVPSMFMVGIPVFEDGMGYRVVVRLRYRVSNGTITWFYEPWRLDLAFKHAFDEACRTAADETGLPLVYGEPEAAA